MKRIYYVFIILFLQINLLEANINITFVDMNKIISTSKPGISVLKQLNEINNKNLDVFKNKEKILKEREEKILAQKKIISDEEFESIVKTLKLDIKKYNDNRNKTIKNFNKLKTDNTNKLLKMINSILIKYSNEKSISIILQKKDLVIGKNELDITDEIIKIVNTDVGEFKIK
ncbi:OmpH family outer membrane protein [Candidatus Pelagibacter sp.]|jgi:outer membrane protein|nr:OmpH family outer membrane protein [Candidatus Pelagibacter sp.]